MSLSHKKRVRLFFAISLPENIKHSLGEVIQRLRSSNKHTEIRWVKPENLHITLQFIGSVNETDVELLVNHVRRQLVGKQSFSFALSTLEFFPNQKHPSVISINLTEQMKLADLAKSIGEGIIASGYPIEKRLFLGHLTLGRIKHIDSIFELNDPLLMTISPIAVNSITLFRSETKPQGSDYFPIATIDLQHS